MIKEAREYLAYLLFSLVFWLISKADELDDTLDSSDVYTSMYSISKWQLENEK